MSCENATKTPKIAQKVFRLLGGEEHLDVLKCRAWNARRNAIRLLFAEPTLHKLVLMPSDEFWQILMLDVKDRELVLVSRVTDLQLRRVVGVLCQLADAWLVDVRVE